MIRSLLYVPANAERFIARAHERGADAIILDLEDGVAPAEKDRARSALAQAVPAVGRGGATVVVRIDTQPGRMAADIAAACRAGAAGLWIPKIGDAAQIGDIVACAAASERHETFLIPAIETAAAVFEARAIAAASPRILGINAGGEDLAASLGGEPIPEVLRLPKLMVHLAARAAGILSFGLLRSVADFRDATAMAAAAKEARSFGFDGATCVHPDIVPILNAAFMPDSDELARARLLLAAAEAAAARGLGAFVFDGKMVDAPAIARAQRLLRRDHGQSRTHPER